MALLAAMSAPASALLGIGAGADGVVSTGGITGVVDVDALVLIGDPDFDDLDDLGDLLDELDLDLDLDGLGLDLDDLEAQAVVVLIVQLAADLGIDLDDLDIELPDIDVDDIEIEAVVALILQIAADLGLDLDDLDLDLDDLDLGDLLDPGDLDLDDLPGGELGPLVEAGRVFVENTTISLGNNILRDADILNDLDIQIGDEDTLSDLLGLANLLPGLPGPGNGDGDDDEEEEENDADVQAAGRANTVQPSASAKPASGPDPVGAAVLEQPTSIAAPLVEVAGAEETAPSRGGPLPRTGGPAGLAGLAAALLGSSGAIRLMIRRRDGRS